MSYLCSNSGPIVRSIEAAIQPHPIFAKSKFKYEEAGDKLVGCFTINDKEYVVTYEGKDIPHSAALQSRLNLDIMSLFGQVVAREQIPVLDLSDYIRDHHVKLIDLVQKNDLSEFNIKIFNAQYNYPYISFSAQYKDKSVHNWYYDKFEANSLLEFLHAISVDLAILHQRYAPSESTKRVPFTIGYGPCSTKNVEVHIEQAPFHLHLKMFQIQPKDILDTENGKLKLKVIYELGNEYLKSVGQEAYCEDHSQVEDVKVPVIRRIPDFII